MTRTSHELHGHRTRLWQRGGNRLAGRPGLFGSVVDPLSKGIEQAREAGPDLEVSARHPPMIASPAVWARSRSSSPSTSSNTCMIGFASPVYFEAVAPGGTRVLSTPYYRWVNNFVIALLGRFHDHVDTLRVQGQSKFWSRHDAALLSVHMDGCIRVPPLLVQ